MNRPGDRWFAVRGFSGTTAADGSFCFSFPAPAMSGIRFRVVGKGGVVDPAGEPPRQGAGPDDVGRRRGPDRAAPSGRPSPGCPSRIAVDTTPSLFRRPETLGLPVFAGRTLTLQRRVDGDTWETLGTSTVQADGMGYFPGVTAAAGTVVYRVRQEDVVSGANRIGWMQTLPDVRDRARPRPGAAAGRRGQAATRAPCSPGARDPGRPRAAAAGAASATASSRYGWYPTLWDYTWEAGQSLTSPPDVGSVRTGWWQDYSDGAGRVSRQNGGLYLDSQRNNGGGPGDFGTTRATLVDAGQAYGRWEARLRLKSAEATAEDFTVLVELVPERPEDYACGRRNITLAQVAAHSATMTFGAKADTRQWTGTRTIPSLIHTSPAVAVEVAHEAHHVVLGRQADRHRQGPRRRVRRPAGPALQHGGRPGDRAQPDGRRVGLAARVRDRPRQAGALRAPAAPERADAPARPDACAPPSPPAGRLVGKSGPLPVRTRSSP